MKMFRDQKITINYVLTCYIRSNDDYESTQIKQGGGVLLSFHNLIFIKL